ncbi:MAG: signal peptide peptidase SppA [Chitinivibrionales bacterium]|nr:signal peptide peptidase SppA [Chitinivibrionales bacterium]
MKVFFTRLFIALGAITFILIVVGILSMFFFRMRARVSDRTILEIDLSNGVIEHIPDQPIARLTIGKIPRVLTVTSALHKAADDDRIKGAMVKLGPAGIGLGHVQEIRDAVATFRKGGKPAWVFSPTFGELSRGNAAYYLAAAFDKIYTQPSASVGLTGLMAKSAFLEETLTKLGIKPRLDHREKYKTALYVLTEDEYIEPHEEAQRAILNSLYDQMITDISESRKIPKEKLSSIISEGPYLAKEALDLNLVDKLTYESDVFNELRDATSGRKKALSAARYLKRAGSPYNKGKTIALIHGVGSITLGKSRYAPLSGNFVMGAETITRAFRAAVNDRSVKAILFRVESPGGSYVASDAIWRETVRAREAGKPVVVSMANVAGSGGYFVAMSAHSIVAHRGTITGSIGVVGGKMLTTEFWNKFGVAWDQLYTSENATIWSTTNDYTPEQWKWVQNWLDMAYRDFMTKAGKGRNMMLEEVREVAKGRIWTGEQAKARGLIDATGSFADALQIAKEAAGIDADKPVKLKAFPRPRTFLERLAAGEPFTAFESNAGDAAAIETLRKLQPIIARLRKMGLIEDPGELSMSEFDIPE